MTRSLEPPKTGPFDILLEKLMDKRTKNKLYASIVKLFEELVRKKQPNIKTPLGVLVNSTSFGMENRFFFF